MPIAATEFSRLHCLVIDDSTAITSYTRALLQDELGVRTVFCANTAEQALEIVRDNFVDVALCDLNMEGIDGFELIRLLKENRFRGHVGIVSSMSVKVIKSTEQLTQLHDLKLLGSISKPVTAAALRKLFDRLNEDKAPDSTQTIHQLKTYELVRGLEQGQFELYYQPKVSASSRDVIGVEALSRFNSPRLGLVMPDQFIPKMEETPLIGELTHYVLKQALADWRDWKQDGEDIRISINVSPKDLVDLHFTEKVADAMKDAGMPGSALTLEIIESELPTDELTTLEVLNRLSIRGIRLSLDDFGAGNTSFERLHNLPFQELKVDKSFVMNAKQNERDRAALESAVVMAKRVGMTVVLEGLESAELYDMGLNIACDDLQGYYVARPMPKSELLDWIRNWRSLAI